MNRYLDSYSVAERLRDETRLYVGLVKPEPEVNALTEALTGDIEEFLCDGFVELACNDHSRAFIRNALKEKDTAFLGEMLYKHFEDYAEKVREAI